MLIFLPTYKRVNVLNLTIDNILNCNFSDINERIILYIFNNCIEDKFKIEEIISLKKKTRVKIKVYHFNNRSCSKIYEDIIIHGRKDEVVHICSDDDYYLHNTFNDRYKKSKKEKSDLYVSGFINGLFFFKNEVFTTFPVDIIKKKQALNRQKSYINDFLISTHTFRNTKKIVNAINFARKFYLNLNHIAPKNVLERVYPLIISQIAQVLKCKVVFCKSINIIRGEIFDFNSNIKKRDLIFILFLCLVQLTEIKRTIKNFNIKKDKIVVIDNLLNHFKESIQRNLLTFFILEKQSKIIIIKILKYLDLSFINFISFKNLNLKILLQFFFPFLFQIRIKYLIWSSSFKKLYSTKKLYM